MKKIVICHLYYDLMNLYGELGNIKALAQNFALQNLEVEVINVTINEPINFKDYDFIIGPTTTSLPYECQERRNKSFKSFLF